MGAVAAIITFALFAGMQMLIKNDQVAPPKLIERPIITLLQNIEDKPTNLRPKLKPKPEPKPQPKLVAKVLKLDPNAGIDNSLFVSTVNAPVIKTDITPIFDSTGGEARPIVRVEPKYPSIAAKDGIEGWVKLSFSITSSGTVDNIKVVDAQPKRVFNLAARRALAKWKYKPNIQAGKSQAQDGMMVMLDFKLAK
jgi:protein TonB